MSVGIDVGTSNTVAVLRQGGRTGPLVFDGSPLLPSAVYLAPDGELSVGRDAERAAASTPERLEAHPTRRIDDGTVRLGERDVPVVELIAALLRRVLAEAGRVAGQPPDRAVLTHPATWQSPRLAVLTDAARLAGLGSVTLVAEPVAAAAYFATVPGHPVPTGSCVVVYDLGAGTFDAAVVRRTDAGFDVLAADGLPDAGGLDLDAAVVGQLRSQTAGAAEAWGRLDWPTTAAEHRARRQLWQDARAARERLSGQDSAGLRVPLVDADTRLTRDEFEKLAGPLLERTVATTVGIVRGCGVGREAVAGVVLVGGASRVPLAARLLHRALGIAPTAIEHPELAVATGAAVPASPPTTGTPGDSDIASTGPSAHRAPAGATVPAAPSTATPSTATPSTATPSTATPSTATPSRPGAANPAGTPAAASAAGVPHPAAPPLPGPGPGRPGGMPPYPARERHPLWALAGVVPTAWLAAYACTAATGGTLHAMRMMLGASAQGATAVVAAFLVPAVLALAGGVLLGRRWPNTVAVTGAALMIPGLALTAVTPNLDGLVLARAVTGLGAGAVIGAAAVLVLRQVKTGRVSAAVVAGIGTGVAAALGPLVGWQLSTVFSWRMPFLLAIPVALAAMVAVTVLTIVQSQQRTPSRAALPR